MLTFLKSFRTSYDLLVSECQTSNGLCYLNPSACLNSYRRLWSGPWAGGCSCEVTRPKLSPSNNVLTGCSEFGRILTQPPCVGKYSVMNKRSTNT